MAGGDGDEDEEEVEPEGCYVAKASKKKDAKKQEKEARRQVSVVQSCYVSCS